ncbi:hypothetical protein [Flavobacterium chungangensis]|uniref:Glycosyltransferase 2-like domain-containing protein n=1 Tax=Flavobacterium chungangensis TaxID=2708132 RepID=A0ABV8ZA22_9FLAO
MDIKVYIVLLNYNNSQDSIECLESILKLQYFNYQVIVIDNSETLQYIEELQSWAEGNVMLQETSFKDILYPLEKKPLKFLSISEKDFLLESRNEKIIFVKAEENKGFAAGNNVALKYILNQNDFDSCIWILNNDTIIEKNSLSDIIEEIQKQNDSKTNIIYGTPLIEYENPEIVQSIGGWYNTKTGLTKHVGEGILIKEAILKFEKIVEKTDYPVGASMIIKYRDLESIGLLSEDYFLFFEEIDWISRAKKINGGVKMLPVFGIYHKQGNSTKSKIKKKKSEFIDLISMKSRITFAKKYNRKNLGFIYLSILTLTIGNRIRQGNFKVIPKILKVIFDTKK